MLVYREGDKVMAVSVDINPTTGASGPPRGALLRALSVKIRDGRGSAATTSRLTANTSC